MYVSVGFCALHYAPCDANTHDYVSHLLLLRLAAYYVMLFTTKPFEWRIRRRRPCIGAHRVGAYDSMPAWSTPLRLALDALFDPDGMAIYRRARSS